MAAPLTAGWYPDPSGVAGLRYFDGFAWTDMYADGMLPRDRPTSGSAGTGQHTGLILAGVVAALAMFLLIICATI